MSVDVIGQEGDGDAHLRPRVHFEGIHDVLAPEHRSDLLFLFVRLSRFHSDGRGQSLKLDSAVFGLFSGRVSQFLRAESNEFLEVLRTDLLGEFSQSPPASAWGTLFNGM